jgi:hypothetical protein
MRRGGGTTHAGKLGGGGAQGGREAATCETFRERRKRSDLVPCMKQMRRSKSLRGWGV